MSESFIARVARGIGTAWFGPQAPLSPAAPPEVAGRQFDYPFGFNLAVTPRGSERTGFAELRGLADASDLVRLAVETRKDQIERLSWRIRPRGIGGNAANDPRIAALTDFFARPDRRNGWHAWLRLLLEDLLVIDAPTLYRRRNRLGGLWALEVLDGSTIKRLIDDWGRTPAPPSPAYQQILKGIPAVDYDATELIYAPRNARVHKAYGFSPVEQVQMAVNIALRRQIYQLQYYTEGNIPEALIGVPESWSPDQIRQFQSYWDSLHLGDTAERRHAKFVPGGVAKTFVPVREPAMKDAFDEWLARIVCYAFSLPPTAFTGQVNRATAETVQDVAVSEGLVPLQNWVKQLIDGVIAEDFDAPDLEFAWDADRDIDPAQTASIAVSYVQAGIKTVDEVRAELGLPPMKGGTNASLATPLGKYREDQTRDWHGRWTDEGTGGGVQVAYNDRGVMSDAGPQLAQAEEDTGRGRGAIQEEYGVGPVRQALFNAARDRLRVIDPANPAIPSLSSQDWVPSDEDVGRMRDALDGAIETHAANAAQYAYEKHVNIQNEFPEIQGEASLQLLAQNVMKQSTPVPIARGRVLFYQKQTNTLVLINPRYPDENNIFRPDDKAEYVKRLTSGK